jgi:hypothetical protein
MDRRVIIGIGIGCGAVILCAVAALVLGGTWLGSTIKEPTDVEVEVNVPLQVRNGQGFLILVTIRDTSGKAQELDSIDISDTYLDGIAIERTEPPFLESFSILGYRSFNFAREIPANGDLIVRFFVVGVRTGDFSGDIDVCINGPGNCLSYPLRSIVGQ